jgi:hypothetical protein
MDTEPTTDNVSRSALIVEYYKSARAELVERVKLRDQVLLVYLGFVGAILGASLTTNHYRELGIVLPFLGLGGSILVSQHNAVIGALIRYTSNDLALFIPAVPKKIPEFVNSPSFKMHSPYSNFLRSFGHGVIIIIPEIAGLGINYSHALASAFPMGPAWWFGAVSTLGSIGVIHHSHQGRKRVYDNTKWVGN